MKTAKVVPLAPEQSVAPQLHQRLRAAIVSGDLLPGERISETAIAATYDVSRQPVREAFIKLAEENLLVVRPQRGTFIRRISIAAALTARFIREAVEADIARRNAQSATPSMIETLEAQLEKQKKAAANNRPAEFMRLDEAFHRLLAELAGVPDVSDYLESLNLQMNRVRNLSARQFAPDKLIEQHSAIVSEIKHGDPDAAEQALRTHLREIQNDLPLIIAANPDYFEDTETPK